MKKRFLSAALALAMVLTLLPATAFATIAAPGTDGAKANQYKPASGYTQVQWVNGRDYSKPQAGGPDYTENAWAWQWVDTEGTIGGTPNKTWWASSTTLTGVVTGTSASGTYYEDWDNDFVVTAANGTKSLRSTSFTIVGKDTVTVSADVLNVGAGLSVNTFGGTLAFGSGAPEKLNSLTVTDTAYTQYGLDRGKVSITRNVGTYTAPTPPAPATVSTSGLNLNVTGAQVTALSLTGRSNTVTLTDVDVTAGITLDGTTSSTTSGTNPVTTKSYDRQSLTINPKATAPYYNSTIAGAISVTGNTNSVALNGVVGTSSAVTVTGIGGTVTASNGTKLSTITVATGASATVNPTLTLASAPASVTINEAAVAGISYAAAMINGSVGTGASTFTVNAQGSVSGPITTTNGTVSIHSANVKAVTVDSGTLNIDGANGTLGAITLGTTTKATKVNLNFSGTGYKGDAITVANAATILTIGTNWPASRSNEFGAIDLKNYAGQGIKGGIFGSIASDGSGAAKSAWFSSDLQFMRKTASNKYVYYGTRELATAIADAGATDAKAQGTISVIGYLANSATGKEALFYNSMVDVGDRTQAVASLTYGASTGIYLPDKINGTQVATWTNASSNDGVGSGTGNGNSTATIYGVNELVPLLSTSSDVKFVLQGSSAAVSKLTNVTASGPNSNVTVTLNNNQITLSGAVGQYANEDVEITCTTDVIGPNGNPMQFKVPVSFNTTTKVATIGGPGTGALPAGVIINNSTNTIQVGNNTYTLSVAGLTKPAPSLKVAGLPTGTTYAYDSTEITGTGIVATVSTGVGNTYREDLIKKIAGPSAVFNWADSPAMRQVVNQAMTTITTDNQIENWATTAQRAAWNQQNRGKSPNTDDLLGTGYTDVVLEPYLAVNVTAYNQSGVMTATLVPSYRVIVVNPNASDPYVTACKGKTGFTAEGYYIAQPGRALSTPITDLTDSDGDNGVTVTFNDLPIGFGTTTVMHQDGTYAYAAAAAGSYVITHAGKTGLGTVVFNTTPALVTMTRATAATNVSNGKAGTYGYDNLQAAVDDTLPQADEAKQDKITVTAAYTGSGVINVTGTARTFKIETQGMTNITRANENFLVGVDAGGHTYTVQLQQSVAAVDGTVEIAVSPTANGTVVPNVSKAKAGQTVTVTVVPAVASQTAKGITVKTNDGNLVPATPTGNVNEYSFVVPEKVTKITVAPDFTSTAAVFTATPTNQGTVRAHTSTADGTVQQGTTVPVTVTPASNYRTMGLTARGNNGVSATVNQVDANTFNVTVPIGATTVTLTPSFDFNNGTPFIDVMSKDWSSPYVSWMYLNGYTTGSGDRYHFEPTRNAYRWEMVYFLYKAAGYPSVAGMSNPFRDVNSSNFYYNAVVWAANKGLIDSSTGYFNPNSSITRADVVSIIWKHKGSPSASTKSGFKDVPTTASYAKAVSWAEKMGITNGKDNRDTFKPNVPITRQEIAKMIYIAFG